MLSSFYLINFEGKNNQKTKNGFYFVKVFYNSIWFTIDNVCQLLRKLLMFCEEIISAKQINMSIIFNKNFKILSTKTFHIFCCFQNKSFFCSTNVHLQSNKNRLCENHFPVSFFDRSYFSSWLRGSLENPNNQTFLISGPTE